MRLLLLFAGLMVAGGAETGGRDVANWIENQGGKVARNPSGQIEAVDLTSTWITDFDLDRIASLAALRKLTLAHTKITDVGLERLKSLKNIQELNCYFCEYVTEDGIAHLKGWKHLESLNLRGTKVTGKVFDHLAQMSSLRSLDLADTQIEDDGFEQLASLTRLERLAIGGNRLEGSALSLLKLLPRLTHLDVSGIQRVDSGLWGLALTDKNLERIAELKQLVSLDLSGANLADRGLDRPGHPEAERSELRDLGPLRSLTNLEKLDLSRTPLVAQALEAVKALPKLRELRLGLTVKLDDAAVESFQKQRPDCRVIR